MENTGKPIKSTIKRAQTSASQTKPKPNLNIETNSTHNNLKDKYNSNSNESHNTCSNYEKINKIQDYFLSDNNQVKNT